MQPVTPLSYINLVGGGIMRGANLELPAEVVRQLLPWGLELGEQHLTRPGYHPVTLFFQEMLRAHMTVPTLLPDMTYHEQILGIPFTYVTRGYPGAGPLGPFFYMPNLYLDNFWATLGGRYLWGLAKQMANMNVTESTWAVLDGWGRRVIALDFEPAGDFRPVTQYSHFEHYFRPNTGIMTQPLVSMIPAGVGPFFVCSDFDKKWDEAVVRPLTSVVHIDQAFVPGLPCGTFPASGRSASIEQSPLGSFEVRTSWRMGLMYPCSMSARWPTAY